MEEGVENEGRVVIFIADRDAQFIEEKLNDILDKRPDAKIVGFAATSTQFGVLVEV